MKERLSVTVDEKVIKGLDLKLDDKIFRNRSHVVEYALKKFLEEKK